MSVTGRCSSCPLRSGFVVEVGTCGLTVLCTTGHLTIAQLAQWGAVSATGRCSSCPLRSGFVVEVGTCGLTVLCTAGHLTIAQLAQWGTQGVLLIEVCLFVGWLVG